MATATQDPARQTIDAEARPALPLSVPQAENGRPLVNLAAVMGRLPNLAAALCKAVLACPAVPNDARNEFHKYDYTSSEAIIAAARTALASNGLVPIPGRVQVNGYEREGVDRFELQRDFLLLHVSGEALVIPCAWPICPDKGRPLDKATGAADTLSLRYFYRGLLMIACKDPEPEVAARDDTARPQAAPPKKAPPDNTPAKLLADVKEREAQLVRDRIINDGQLLHQVHAYGGDQRFPADVKDWNEAQVKAARAHLKTWVQATRAARARAASPAPK